MSCQIGKSDKSIFERIIIKHFRLMEPMMVGMNFEAILTILIPIEILKSAPRN